MALEPSISNPLHGKEKKKSYYAPYRLLSGVHTFSVLNRGTLEFGPRALAEFAARGGRWGEPDGWCSGASDTLSNPVGGDSRGQLGVLRVMALSQATRVASWYLCN